MLFETLSVILTTECFSSIEVHGLCWKKELHHRKVLNSHRLTVNHTCCSPNTHSSYSYRPSATSHSTSSPTLHHPSTREQRPVKQLMMLSWPLFRWETEAQKDLNNLFKTIHPVGSGDRIQTQGRLHICASTHLTSLELCCISFNEWLVGFDI